MTPSPQPTRRPVRWWPAVAILVLMTGFLATIWLREVPSTQARVLPTFPVVFFGVLLLWLWSVLFSRLPGSTRLRILLVGVVAIGLGLTLFEIQGVSGNLVPILGYRWAGHRVFDATSGAAGVTDPGPDDYPQFYGPDRTATLPGPRLARDWEARPPREIWRREVGEGWSSFAVVGDAAVTMEQRGDDEVVVRYHLRTGEQVWLHADPAPFNTTVGGRGPRATPTIADGRVYTLGATGLLSCLDLTDGKAVWQRNILEENQIRQPPWGMTSSPLVVDDLIVVQTGYFGTSLVAHDRRTGELVWESNIGRGAYSSPILATLAGQRQVLIVNGDTVTGHHPETGAILWRQEWPGPGDGIRITPPLLMGGDRILVSAGYGVGSLLVQISRELDVFSTESLWESRRLKSKFASMVLHRGVVYGLDDGILVALDPATGERLWKRGRYGHGQMILVGDLLLIQTEKGEVALVEPVPEEHRELGRFRAFDAKTWNPPALSGRLLLVRNNREAACFEMPVEDS